MNKTFFYSTQIKKKLNFLITVLPITTYCKTRRSTAVEFKGFSLVVIKKN